MTATDTRPAPEVSIDAHHLSITRRWGDRGTHNIQLHENRDLAVILDRGQERLTQPVPHNNVAGFVVVAVGVGVDADHDEVHYSDRESDVGAEELLAQVIDTLEACRESLRRIRKSGA